MQGLSGKQLCRNAAGRPQRGVASRGSSARQRGSHLRVFASAETEYSGASISPPKRGKHFLHLDDFSKDELLDMLDKAKMAKAKLYARDESFKPFKGQTMAMIFTKPSARTRVSFETVGDAVVRSAKGARARCCGRLGDGMTD